MSLRFCGCSVTQHFYGNRLIQRLFEVSQNDVNIGCASPKKKKSGRIQSKPDCLQYFCLERGLGKGVCGMGKGLFDFYSIFFNFL